MSIASTPVTTIPTPASTTSVAAASLALVVVGGLTIGVVVVVIVPEIVVGPAVTWVTIAGGATVAFRGTSGVLVPWTFIRIKPFF